MTAVTDRNPLLDRVGLLHIAQSFDRNNMLAIDGDEGGKTSIDRGMVYLLRCLVEVRNDLYISPHVSKMS